MSEKESLSTYQRNRLRNLDSVMILLLSIFSFLVTGVNLALGKDNAVAVLPLLIPLLVFPLIDGVIIGIVIKDSLRWRARGWSQLFMGSFTIIAVSLAYYFSERLSYLYYLMTIILLTAPVVFVFLLDRSVRAFYKKRFSLIRVKHDLDTMFAFEGLFISLLIASSSGYWFLTVIKIIPLSYFINVFFFTGVYLWVLSALEARNWLPKWAYIASVFYYISILTAVYFLLMLFYGP